MWLLASLFWQTIPVRAQQQTDQLSVVVQEATSQNGNQIFKNLLRQGRGAEYPVVLEKIFGSEAERMADAFDEDSERLFQDVTTGASRKADESLQKQIKERKEKPRAKTIIEPEVKTAPKAKPVRKTAPRSKRVGFHAPPKLDWRQFAFGFQPLPQQPQDGTPEIKFTQTDKEIIATGEAKKSFETADVKGTRTQKAETRHINDGAKFGIEIKNTQIIEAVSKTDGKTFRTETVMMWGAEVAACPDANGVTTGTGKAKVGTKTVFSEGGQTATITSDFDLQAKLIGFVSDEAELTHYDLQVDAYVTNSGQEDASSAI
jgi:hypothetical protein